MQPVEAHVCLQNSIKVDIRSYFHIVKMCVSVISFREIHESDFHLQGPPAKHDEIWQNNASNASSSWLWEYYSRLCKLLLHGFERFLKFFLHDPQESTRFGEGVHLLTGLHDFPSNATPEHLKRQTYRLFRSLCLLCLWGFLGIGTWNGTCHIHIF